MKKILSLVIALIAIGQLNAKGIEPSSPVGMSVIKNGALVKLFYRGEQSGRVKVAIYNENGFAVYKETMQNTENFMRPYNFSTLPAGDYTIEITDQQGKRYKTIKHAGSNEKTRIAHLTRLNARENRYMLAVPNKGEDQLQVKIYDETNSIVYEETETISGHFAKVYDLSKIEGNHTFQITDKSGKINRLSKPLR